MTGGCVTQAQIDRLEYRQGRAMRELLLDLAPKLPAVDQAKIARLQAIDDEIAILRAAGDRSPR
jgi:hypothetical protein